MNYLSQHNQHQQWHDRLSVNYPFGYWPMTDSIPELVNIHSTKRSFPLLATLDSLGVEINENSFIKEWESEDSLVSFKYGKPNNK